MISRKTWTDAIAGSNLPATVRAVLREMATRWPHGTTRPTLTHQPSGDEPRSWQEFLAARTGLSTATIKRAWRTAEDAGFLVVVRVRRQHYAPEYAPTIPTPQTGHRDRSEGDQTGHQSGHADRSETTDESPRPVTVSAQTGQPDRSLIGVELQTPTTPTAGRPLADAGFAVVVVKHLPLNLGRAVARPVLAQALAPAAALGWTPELVADAVRAHDWAGARTGGAVIAWARDLAAAPPEPVVVPEASRLCEIHGTTYRRVCAGCRADAIAVQAGTG